MALFVISTFRKYLKAIMMNAMIPYHVHVSVKLFISRGSDTTRSQIVTTMASHQLFENSCFFQRSELY